MIYNIHEVYNSHDLIKSKKSIDLDNVSGISFKDHLIREKKQFDKKNLLNACYEFEAFFIEKVFDSVRKTLSNKNIFGSEKSFLENWAVDKLYQSYSKNLSKTNNFGLAQQMYSKLSKLV